MIEKEIIESNEMIAQFMGGVLIIKQDMFDKERTHRLIRFEKGVFRDMVWNGKNNCTTENPVETLLYHAYWDWLMPVVEKIETMEHFEPGVMTFMPVNYQVTISEQAANVLLDGRLVGQCFADSKTKIESVHQVCVKFIEWYQGNRK